MQSINHTGNSMPLQQVIREFKILLCMCTAKPKSTENARYYAHERERQIFVEAGDGCLIDCNKSQI